MSHENKISRVYKNLTGFPAGSGFWIKFKNEGSDDMRVDGSDGGVIFSLEDLPTPEYFLLNRVTFAISAGTEAIDLNNFGGIAGLTNGIRFVANDDEGPEHKAEAIIQTNGDVFLISSHIQLDSVRVSGSVQITQLHGAWDFTDTFNDNSPVIHGKDLKIVVRDDLSGMDYFRVACHGITLQSN